MRPNVFKLIKVNSVITWVLVKNKRKIQLIIFGLFKI